MDLRDLKTFLHLAESRHFGRSARAMHVSPSTLSRQIQRLEEDLGQPLFVRDNRTVTLTEAGEELRTFAQQTLLQYQQLRHVIDQQGPSLSGELHIFCSVTAAYSHLPPILDRFRAAHPSVEIKLSTGDAADAMEKVVTGEADLAIAGKPETLPGSVAFSMLENLAVVLIAPALPCPVRNQVTVERPDWSTVPFIMADQGRYVGASSCGFGGIKSAIRRSTPPSAGTKRWCRWSPWDAAWRCCRKWCWRTVRSRYATG
ncbi:DNA-binding transcriptional regulator IlvY [Klebsiella pneumoniae]|uniref:DNA-binding transcriptional regulator IlvY n=1 Tax=Klebsiella pneumoniae TaxID=573 RepID=A0A377ZSA3_KLEPN|nr:DNA-binding transcriptional regulator IlvY [Klebsiella pneumoniae]VFS36727.1 Cyn operon transcriptional activator [Serratia liquefaciens]